MYIYRTLVLLAILLVMISTHLSAQKINLSTQVGIQKPFKLNKKHRLSISARISANPEWETVEQLSDNELWRDLDLLPVSDEDDDDEDDDDEQEDEDDDNEEEDNDDEDDDDEDEKEDNQPWTDPLDDSARQLTFDPRTAFGLQYQWRLKKQWRVLASYNAYWRGEGLRHGLDWGGQWRSRLKTKRWAFDQSFVIQQVFRPKQSTWEISHGTRARARAAFNLTDNHQIRLASSINGNWREDGFRIDRLRLETEIRYSFSNNHRISLRLRVQKRLYRPDEFTPGLQLKYDYIIGLRDHNDID